MEVAGINKKSHVYADCSYVPAVLAAPALAGFEENKPAAMICWCFALTALAWSLCTKAKWGVLKIIPYRVHASLDLGSGVLALAVSAVPAIRKNGRARFTLIAMGLTGLVVGTLSLVGASKNNALKIVNSTPL